MKDARHTTLQPFPVIECFQCVPSRTEHAGIEQSLMRQGNGMQAVGNGEHHMKVLHSGEYLILAHVNPRLTLLALAFGAVAVAAAVVAHMYAATLRTFLDMPSQPACAAGGQGCERLVYLGHA